MKTKSERIETLYEYAKKNGFCKNRKTFAELIGVNPTNIGKAFQENSPYLTDKLLYRINAVLNYAFNAEWISSGEGEMLSHNHINGSNVAIGDDNTQVVGNNNSVGIPTKNFAHENDWMAIIEEKDRQISRLLTILENMTK